MSSRLKRRVGALAAGAALSVFALTGIANAAQAQSLLKAGAIADEQIGDVVGVQSDTVATESVAENGRPLVGGAVESTTEVAAPVAPVEGAVSVDAPVAVDEVVGQDVCVQAGINAPAGECGATAPEPPAPVTADVGGNAQITEPIAPVEGGADIAANADAAPVAVADVCLGLGVNAATGECETPNDPAPGDPAPVAPIVGDVDAGIEADVPLPVETGAVVDSDVVADGLAVADVCVGAGVNEPPGTCEGSPGDGTPDGDGIISGDVNPTVEADLPLPVEGAVSTEVEAAFADLVDAAGICANVAINDENGECADNESNPDEPAGDGEAVAVVDVENQTEVNVPLPVAAETDADASVVADELAAVGVCLGAGVNQTPDDCGSPGNGDPGNGDPGNGDPGDDPVVDGDVESGAQLDVPLPVETGVGVDASAVVDEIIGVDACVGFGVNRNPGSCGENLPNPPGDGGNPDDDVKPGGGSDSGNDPGDPGAGDGGNVNDSGDEATDFGDTDFNDALGGFGGGDSGSFVALSPLALSPANAVGADVVASEVSGAGSDETVFTSSSGDAPGTEGADSSNDEGDSSVSSNGGLSDGGYTQLPDTGGFSAALLFGTSLFIGLGLFAFAAAYRRRRLS